MSSGRLELPLSKETVFKTAASTNSAKTTIRNTENRTLVVGLRGHRFTTKLYFSECRESNSKKIPNIHHFRNIENRTLVRSLKGLCFTTKLYL